MRFEFATSTRIIFGPGTLKELPDLLSGEGRHALIVTGPASPPPGTLVECMASEGKPIRAWLKDNGVESSVFVVDREPSLDTIRRGLGEAKEAGCNIVVGLGGGSALDAGKAISCLLANGGDPLDYLEVIGKGRPIAKASVPFIAIPTTAGTGSEVTSNAVLASTEHKIKVSLRSPLMLPKVALVDPELTCGMPPALTASTGMDALTQVIEPFVSNKANPFTDAICLEGIRRGATSIRRVYESPNDIDARAEMSLVSLFGGMALANAKLGAVHGFAAVLGGMFEAPHGALCARLLPAAVAVNLQALLERAPGSPTLERYTTVARLLLGNPDSTAHQAVAWLDALATDLRIPTLRDYGMKTSHFPQVVEDAARASSMKGNPIELTPAELTEILERSL